MYDTHKDLLDAFRVAPEVFSGLLDGVSQEAAQAARGGDEGWSVIEVLCHLRDAEERALERTRAMRDANAPLLEAYDQDAWAVERHYAAENLAAALDAFIALRRQHVADLEALPPAAWDRPGRHSEYGEISIQAQVLHLVSHDLLHAAQIARQLGTV